MVDQPLAFRRCSYFGFCRADGRLIWSRVLLNTFTMPFQERACLDCKVIVENIADHMCFSRKFDRTGSNLAVNRTVNDDGVRYDLALNVCRLTD